MESPTESSPAPPPPSLRFHFGNSDEVVTPPPGAAVLATAGDSPAVALAYDCGNGDDGSDSDRTGWCSTQFHPEASHGFFQHLVTSGIIVAATDQGDQEGAEQQQQQQEEQTRTAAMEALRSTYVPLDSGRLLIRNFLVR